MNTQNRHGCKALVSPMTLVNVLPRLRGEAAQGVQSASALLLGILQEFPVSVLVCVGGAARVRDTRPLQTLNSSCHCYWLAIFPQDRAL